MIILPAIDLKNGNAVRLTKGQINSAKVYSNNPIDFAKFFQDCGAQWIHIVDLNGAFNGEICNFNVIENIAKNTNLNIEVGGGIRDEKSIKIYKDCGVKRFILGSIAVKDVEFTKQMAKKYSIAVGIDVKDNFVAISGWDDLTNTRAIDLAQTYKDSDIQAIICTDISRDGMLSGINMDLVKDIKQHSCKMVIASGGLSCIDDIYSLKNSNIDAVIVGKAFYEGKIDLKKTFEIANG